VTDFAKVIVIILNWNNAGDTLQCLASLESLTYPNYGLLIVDNGSTDDSVQRIRAVYSTVTLLETGENLGYAGGNNVGIRYALEQGADYVLLLNDDVVLAEDAISALLKVAVQHPEAGFLGPNVYIMEQPEHLLSSGGVFAADWCPFHRGMGERHEFHDGDGVEVDFLSGCALLVARTAMEKIGLLDEDFFTYGEDVEWCFRGKRAGFKVLLVPQAKVWHPDTRLRDENSARVMYYITRNHLLFLRKHRLGKIALGRAWMRNWILLINWSINPKWRHIRPKRDALWLAMRDFVLGRFGKSQDM